MIGRISGQMNVSDFVKRVYPKAMDMPTTDDRFGMKTAIDDIHQHMDRNADWDFEYLFYDYLGLLHVDDKDFLYFLEQYTHPVVRRGHITHELDNECVDAINKYLVSDGYKLTKSQQVGDKVIYSATSMSPGVKGTIKNIIFASKYKPEIVLGDALNNDIKIVNNQDKCLVYDRNVLSSGISWNELKSWYDKLCIRGTRMELKDRLRESLNSAPEYLFYDTYIEIKEKYQGKIPALLPQVYLYYDPKLRRDRNIKIFEHQRMDFLMIFSETQRVVIEIDGIQHYADYVSGNNNYYASVDKYAEMVSAQREMTLAGYDVYRFGGKELHDNYQGKRKIKEFFKMLFEKYQISE